MILATVNQFRLGGTETYLASVARAMSARGHGCALATSQLVEGAPHLDAFASVELTGDGSRTRILEQWLEGLDQMLARQEIRAVWSHHYDLLPIWAATRVHRLPLVTTFHGPLTGAGRPNSPLQALGMTLAIHRGEAVTCVSDEAAETVRGLRPEHPRLWITPNRVELGSRARSERPPEIPPRRFLLVARPQKLTHIRNGLSIFQDYARWRTGCTLDILAAEESVEKREAAHGVLGRLVQRGRLSRRRFGARWCMKRPLSFLRMLPQLRFPGASESVTDLMAQADVVLGMGRVILEGFAAGRPTALIGYEYPHGIVTAERLGGFAYSNFSGRGCEALTIAESVGELRGLGSIDWKLEAHELTRFDVERTVDQLEDIFAAIGPEPSPGDEDEGLARRIGSMARRGRSDDHVLDQITQSLAPAEHETLRRLIDG